MDIGSIFLLLALLIIIILFVSRPIFERKATVVTHEEQTISALMAERDQVINALAELDFDHALGKIPEEDYPEQRMALLKQGAEILRQLDQSLVPNQVSEAGTTSESGDAEARIEAAIAARRMTVTANGAPRNGFNNGDDEIERRIASRRRERQEKSAGFCPKCGRPVQKSDRYCPGCGGALF